MQTELIEVDYDQDLYEEMKLEDKDLYVAYKIIYEGDDIPEDEDEFADSIQKEESTSTRESSPLKETFLNKFSSKFSSSSSSGTQPNPSVSINDGDLQPEKSSPTDQGITKV